MNPETDDNDTVSNTSAAPALRDIMAVRLSRRNALKGVALAGAWGLFGCATPAAQSDGESAALTFVESGRFLDETHHVSPGYRAQPVIRWGDPIHAGGPAFRPGAQTADEQERQFGMNNDFVAYMPLPRGSNSSVHGLLCVNNEYAIAHLMFPNMTRRNSFNLITREQCEVELASVGHSVVEVALEGGVWRVLSGSRYNRRISARSTLTRVSGPAAGHPRMVTREDPSGTRVMGTYGNCAGGVTPWGTVLIAEENIDYGFRGNTEAGREAAAWKRFGLGGSGRHAWGNYFDRFNLDKEPNEPNRFGWIVEFDPYDPASVPVKRTALGRCKHECATTAVSHNERVAVYSGDDERMEYVYKFVTHERYDAGNPAGNRDLLDNGTLYVARFDANGKMHWLPLVHGQGPLTQANGFGNQGDVMIEMRRAADLLGATPMDRPEDVEAHPQTGHVYVALTFNETRKPDQVDAANPRGPNKFGHIIEIVPPLINGKPDHTATECRWEFFIVGGDPKNPEHDARYHGNVSANGWIAAPDNIAFDPKGRIWIATDGQDDWVGFADSVYAAETSGPRRGATRCLFSAPRGAECTGPAFTPDGKTLFLSVQHPGHEADATFDKPPTRWPDFRPDIPPRSAVVAITKADGGEIGT